MFGASATPRLARHPVSGPLGPPIGKAGTTSTSTERSTKAPETLASYIRRTTAINVARCYQCGKCSAGCPMGGEMKLPPHDLMRYAIAGDRERLFNDDSLWLCLTCETCSARCPNDVDPARVIDALRELAALEGAGHGPRNVAAFHKSFLEQIRMTGRLSEVGLIMQYKMRSGALFQDVAVVPSMLERGKLPLVPSRIRGHAEIKSIMAACARAQELAAAALAGTADPAPDADSEVAP